MNKKEKNKNKPRIPGSRQLMKACHFYKSFLGLSEKHTPKSPAGRVWKDQLPGSPGSQATATACSFLQCSALQAQVTSLREQNAQHVKDLESTAQMSGVEATAADPSEKVS